MNSIQKYKKYKHKKTKNNDIYKKKYKYYKVMVGGLRSLDKQYLKELDNVIKTINASRDEKSQIDESHGLHHGLIVLCNVAKALDYNSDITARQKLLVKLAALLHDIDDHKYFPNNHKFENARMILNRPEIKQIDILTDNEIASILLMIYLVSSSTHGDTMPTGLPEWYFYPRYADRLEALGLIGLERTLEYNIKKKQPLFNSDTARAKNKDELLGSIATEERYKNYSLPGSASASMIDHFYDKLLRLGNFPIDNEYFKTECERRISPLVDFCLEFSKQYPNGHMLTTDENIEEIDNFKNFVNDFIKNCSQAVRSECEQLANLYLPEIRQL